MSLSNVLCSHVIRLWSLKPREMYVPAREKHVTFSRFFISTSTFCSASYRGNIGGLGEIKLSVSLGARLNKLVLYFLSFK